MKKVYGYLRVSTAKQGEGVSLIVQKEAITRYTEQYHLEIVQWFEEKETAAKQGRPLFMQMMQLLRLRKAHGVVIHKIDRSARNLKDWVDLGNLIDQGIEVHFVHESLDLNARSGRLSADIQAVIAADYIRNLRQEAIKGIYGRLKQGIYPFHAPIGYKDTGKGKVKAVDPIQGPLVRKAFELYATKKYTLNTLRDYMDSLGLRNIHGKKLNLNSLSILLHNPFYIGVLSVKGQSFKGEHEALIESALYKRVQDIMESRDNQKTIKHRFLYSRLLNCKYCAHALIGETQKGIKYYRCHTKICATKGIRETAINNAIGNEFKAVCLSEREFRSCQNILKQIEVEWSSAQRALIDGLNLQIGKLQQKIERLTDCYVEGGLDKETFEQRKMKLFLESRQAEEMKENLEKGNEVILKRVGRFLELSKTLVKSFEIGNLEEKRQLLEMVTSNFEVEGKKLTVSMSFPFSRLKKRLDFLLSPLERGQPRRKNIECTYPGTNTPLATGPSLTQSQLRSLIESIIAVMQEDYDRKQESDAEP